MFINPTVGFFPHWKYANIGKSPVLEEFSFWFFLGDIPGKFLHYFQIITNLSYVCLAVSWLTSLLKKANIGISPGLDEIYFWIFLETFLICLYTFFQIITNFLYVSQSFSWLTSLLWYNLIHLNSGRAVDLWSRLILDIGV